MTKKRKNEVNRYPKIRKKKEIFPFENNIFETNNQDTGISSIGFSLVERPARSSEEGKVLWERKTIKGDGQNTGYVEVRESWNSEILHKREDGAVVPMVKEDYEDKELGEKLPESLIDQEEVVIHSSKWQTEKNEFESKLTVRFDRNVNNQTLFVNSSPLITEIADKEEQDNNQQQTFVEYQQISPKKQ